MGGVAFYIYLIFFFVKRGTLGTLSQSCRFVYTGFCMLRIFGAALLFFGFAGITIFGMVIMSVSMNSEHGGCFVALAQGEVSCFAEALSSLASHFSFFNQLTQVIVLAAFLLILLGALFFSVAPVFVSNPPVLSRIRAGSSFAVLAPKEHAWVSRLETSPTLL